LNRNADLTADPTVFGVVTRMPKRQRPQMHARVKVKLDTVMGVAREMGRLIRLSYNGHLPPEELTKYIFALDKLRGCLESAVAIEANAIANAPPPPPGETHINIMTIPAGHFVTREQLEAGYDWGKSWPTPRSSLRNCPLHLKSQSLTGSNRNRLKKSGC
jgi:hypothetical protein